MAKQRSQADLDRVPKYTLFFANHLGKSQWSDVDGPPWLAPKRNVQVIAWEDATNSTERISGNNYYVYEVETGEFVGASQYTIDQRLEADTDFVAFYGYEISPKKFQDSWDDAIDDQRFWGYRRTSQQIIGMLQAAAATEDYRTIMDAIRTAYESKWALVDIDVYTKAALNNSMNKVGGQL